MEDGRCHWPKRNGLTKVRRLFPPERIPPRLLRQPHPQPRRSKERHDGKSAKVNPILHRKSVVMKEIEEAIEEILKLANEIDNLN